MDCSVLWIDRQAGIRLKRMAGKIGLSLLRGQDRIYSERL